MNINIKDIHFHNIVLLGTTDKMIYYFRSQNYDAALRMSDAVLGLINVHISQLIENIDYFNEAGLSIELDYMLGMLKGLLSAQKCRDYLLIADIYEVQLQPFLYLLQETIINKGEAIFDEALDLENREAIRQLHPELAKQLELIDPVILLDMGYSLEYTSCGFMTIGLMDEEQKYYLHSNHDVLKEGFVLAQSWYSEEYSKYILYGLGLGYHVEEFADLDSNHTIEIYESDINIIRLACAFTYFKKFVGHSNIKLIYDPEFSILFQSIAKMEEGTKFLIHSPSIRNIKDISIKQKLENYFIQYSSMQNQSRILSGNFKHNVKNYDALVDELRPSFQGKDLYIVAAGPSLDKNYIQLKNIGRDAIILATGTVFRKLLKAGIVPDYFIVIDANSRILGQIGGYETATVPMIFLSTAYFDFARIYKGKKYMICQKDYNKAEAFAEQNGAKLFITGGSVSTIALDIGIQFDCKRIIFLGLDLAYSDNHLHATGTSMRDLTHSNNLRQVLDINNKLVYTGKSLDIYRGWIENRIKDVKNIEFIDATEGGAKIKGMRIMKLSDCINLSGNSDNS